MSLPLTLFVIGVLGFVLHRKHILILLITLEMILLGVTIIALISTFKFDDASGQTISVFIISVAGAESAIGLGILVAYFRLRGTVSLPNLYLTIVLLPFIGATFAGFRGRIIGVTGATLITTSCIGISCIIA